MWVRSVGREDPLELGNGNPLQYPCLGNPVDRGAWRAAVQGGRKRVGQELATKAVTGITESLCGTPGTITTFKSAIGEHLCVFVCMFYRLCVSERGDRSKEEQKGKERHSHVSMTSREESRTSPQG